MKKFSFFIMLLFTASIGFAQTLDDINKLMGKEQYAKAKEGIDKYLADSKNAEKGDGWYYKGRIYNSLSKDSSLSNADAIKLKTDAFEAFKKYQVLDKKQLSFILENYGSYFDLYNGYFDIGAKAFNNKNFALSYEGFQNALQVEEYVKGKGYEYNGFKFPSLDTSLITNTAIAASQAKDEVNAMKYYKKLADANLSSPDYLNVYQVLVDYYSRTNDETNLAAMLEKGRTHYPNDEYWTEVEIDRVSKAGGKAALIAKYEELMKKYPEKYTYSYNLGVELYNELYAGDNKPANPTEIKDKLTEVLKTAISIDKEKKGVDAKMLMTRHLYNSAYDYQDSSNKIKSTKPDDIKKKNNYTALFNKNISDCIPYAEDVVAHFDGIATLKPLEKVNYKVVLDILSQLYNTKGNKLKSAEIAKKKATVDKM